MTTETMTSPVTTPEELLEHWQGHRRLTRRTIEAFPEDKLFTYSVGGMRPFSDLAMEFIHMTIPGVKGLATGKWENYAADSRKPTTKQELLQLWDETTKELDRLWPTIPAHRFRETDRAFGQWEGTGSFFVSYWVDNEIHHRGQGYVYLRSLGIAPPPFWER